MPSSAGGRGWDPPREQDPGSLTAAAPSPSAPFPGPSPRRLSQASAGPGRILSPIAPGERGKAAALEPSILPATRALPGPRTPASPSAAAEAAVGPIVVGIKVRHLPSPLREEPG